MQNCYMWESVKEKAYIVLVLLYCFRLALRLNGMRNLTLLFCLAVHPNGMGKSTLLLLPGCATEWYTKTLLFFTPEWHTKIDFTFQVRYRCIYLYVLHGHCSDICKKCFVNKKATDKQSERTEQFLLI